MTFGSNWCECIKNSVQRDRVRPGDPLDAVFVRKPPKLVISDAHAGLTAAIRGIRRHTRVVRIFPNEASYLRLTAGLLMEQTEDWFSGRAYISRQSLRPLLDS